MEILMTVLLNFVLIALDVISLAMLARAILSWFDQTGESAVSAFLYTLTEPFILPIRALFDRFGWFENSMLDVPFFVTLLILSGLQTLLQLLW